MGCFVARSDWLLSQVTLTELRESMEELKKNKPYLAPVYAANAAAALDMTP